MTLNLLEIILLLAAAQAAFLGILILHKYPALLPNRILGIMMLLYAIILGHNLAVELGFFNRYPHWLLLPLGITLMLAPLHFLYAKYLTHPEMPFGKKDWLHFLPAGIYWFSLLPDLWVSSADLSARLNISSENMSPRFLVFNFILLLQAMLYLGLTFVQIKKFHARLRNMFASVEKLKLTWLQQITLLLLSAWMVFSLEEVALMFGVHLTHFDLSSALVALYVFLMGYMALLKSEIFQQPALLKPMHILECMETAESADTSSRYEKSGLTSERAQALTRTLLDLMRDEEPFTDNELTLADLAERLRITPHNLSEILNTQVRQNFYDFINQYRIEKAKRDLADPAKSHLKILAIAFEAGFNSKTAFNTIFKHTTRMTPSAYRTHSLSTPS